MKKKIIVGVHGLGNKPPRKTLRRWWKLSTCEGLSQIGHPKHFFKLELVYWAHFMHSEPLNVKIKDKSNPLYVEYPYVRGRKKKVQFSPSKLKKIRAHLAEKMLDAIFLKEHKFVSFDWFSDFIIRKKFQDLALYFDKSNVADNKPGLYAKRKIGEELASTL
ncbi:hypothetical protein GWO43_26730, partial [candidate division KSB1 bacterium]|nr:hypothetical protein [candidate division KSB1 bacterium]NIR70132.1 hypothetical protein [candidate division KSB1 bacterium]NIS27547.1 hypothetical protein [candidate division KSB1 bacterium]NIT74397.1 hypothetical protein [candidate division KSB1 bacterium]NIU28265.1 hypothetical protein [candidate division KSB1 bacterium]